MLLQTRVILFLKEKFSFNLKKLNESVGKMLWMAS